MERRVKGTEERVAIERSILDGGAVVKKRNKFVCNPKQTSAKKVCKVSKRE